MELIGLLKDFYTRFAAGMQANKEMFYLLFLKSNKKGAGERQYNLEGLIHDVGLASEGARTLR